MRFAYRNLIDDLDASAMTALSAVTGFPLANVQDERLAVRWLTDTGTSQSAYFTLPTFPSIPNNTAGTTYLSNFTGTAAATDGWVMMGSSGSALCSIVNARLVFKHTGINQYINKTLSIAAGRQLQLRVRLKAGTPSSYNFVLTNTVFIPPTATLPADGSWLELGAACTTAGTSFGFYLGTLATESAYYELEFDVIYVGTGLFNESIADHSGNGNHMTTVCGVAPVQSSLGSALMFISGNTNSIIYTAGNVLLKNQFTFSLDVLHLSFSDAIVMCKFGDVPYIRNFSASLLSFQWKDVDGVAQTLNYTATRLLGVWYNYIITHDGITGEFTIDGVVAGSDSGHTSRDIGLSNITVGGFTTNTYNLYGYVRAPRVWNRALSRAERLHVARHEHFAGEKYGLLGDWTLDSDYQVDTVALFGHNLIPKCTVRVQASNTGDWDVTELDEYLTIGPDAILKFLDQKYCYRYWKFSFNGQESLEIGRIWLGEFISVSPSSTLEFRVVKKHSDNVIHGKGRQKFASVGEKWRRIEIAFPRSDDAMVTEISRMVDEVGSHSSVIFCNFDDLREYELVEPMYCSIDPDVGFVHTSHMRFTYELALEEEK